MPNEIDPRLLLPPRHQPHVASPLHRWRRRRSGGGHPRSVLPGGMRFGQRHGEQPQSRRRRRRGQRHTAHLELAAVHGRRLRRRVPDRDGHHGRLQGRLQRQRAVVRQGQGTAVSASRTSAPISRCRPRSWPLACNQLGWLNEISDAGWSEQEEPAPGPSRRQRRPRTQVQRAVHVGHRRPGLQPGGHRPGHHDDRRHVGSRLQGQGQHVLRHPGRPRHAHAVAGHLAGRSHHRDDPEGHRRGQGTEGQGPDPALHRQRLRR